MSIHKRIKLGILGGGQLGRMLIQCLLNYDVEVHVIDPDADAPCRYICHNFVQGDLMDKEAVLRFCKGLDIVTIEIEHVNTDALFEIKNRGIRVVPEPEAIKTIQDKGLQKEFYSQHQIPTSPFELTNEASECKTHKHLFPAFHKMRTLGYDGKGVKYLQTVDSIGFEGPSVLEKAAQIKKEISVIVAVNTEGEIRCFPVVEMVFNPEYNLVDYLISPTDLPESIIHEAEALGIRVAKALNSPGIFAIEMFLLEDDTLWVNETAPRTHNSGHQSIEGNYTSQFEQQARILLNLPLGITQARSISLMMNLLGEKNHSGDAVYVGLQDVVKLQGVFLHLYGKKQTKAGRKMGHITITGENKNELIEKYKYIREKIKIESN